MIRAWLPALLLCFVFTSAAAGDAKKASYLKTSEGIVLPDPSVTPGDVIAGVPLKTLCRVGYTDTVRNVPRAVAEQVYRTYGARWAKGKCCEIDHFIPLGLGGSNDVRNLWAQPYVPTPGARQKDVLELHLRREVCAGRMKLRDAQEAIRNDWPSAYRRLKD